ncbi:MAG: T9SS type A sorting domain-containing protein [Bacteroidia bacterium]
MLAAIAGNDIKLGQNYPNPAKEKTYVEVTFDTPTASLKVYNVLGKMLLQETLGHSGTYMINVTDYPEGVYIYTLEADGEKITKRMTVKK